ncbi:MAG: hypothetical protein A2W31_13645 [Planctomycetes bacterium RBG_16_64_10]|nr:MAG: hypothetical protein A2W31_13645 [Planctomycetes bacterium RBG_16_64_10]
MMMSELPPKARSEDGARWQWILPLLGLIALAAIVTLRSFGRHEVVERAGGGPAGKHDVPRTAQLHVDYGDGVKKHFTALRWHTEMTVANALEAAAHHRRGIQYSFEGKGRGAMLTSIDGLANQGGGPNARNWIYYVNGRKADKSFAVHAIGPGDVVLWRFQGAD